jgi:hypothetical protein
LVFVIEYLIMLARAPDSRWWTLSYFTACELITAKGFIPCPLIVSRQLQ